METLANKLGHDVLRHAVRDRYGRVASDPDVPSGFPVGEKFAEAVDYPRDLLDSVPLAAASFTGVGTPVAFARLQPGETVLELGCGAGLDTTWAAPQVQPGGRIVALDMAFAMVRSMRENVAGVALRDVLPVVAEAEALPLPTDSVDVVVVNGIFNLAPDKAAVLREIRRVLRPAGRLVVSEVALTKPLAPGEASTIDDWFR